MGPITRLGVLGMLLCAPACVFDEVTDADPNAPGGSADAGNAEPATDAAVPPSDGGLDVDDDDDDEDDDDDDDEEDGGNEDDAGTCEVLSLQAEKKYEPTEYVDGSQTFAAPHGVILPAALSVEHGNGGNHCARLTLRDGDDERVCLYQGGSAQSAPSPDNDLQWDRGLAYEFVVCTEDSSTISNCASSDPTDDAVGSSIVATRVELHIENGAYRTDDPSPYWPTRVQVSTAACTSDD